MAAQTSNSQFGRRLCAVLAFAILVIASLMLPPQLEEMRSGHWAVEHFLAYFAAVPIICLAWPRPFLVAAALIPSAALLEALQCLEPGHSPNIFAALSSIGGVLAGALLATLLLRVRTLTSRASETRTRDGQAVSLGLVRRLFAQRVVPKGNTSRREYAVLSG